MSRRKRSLSSFFVISLGLVVLIWIGIGVTLENDRIGLDGKVRPWSLALVITYFRASCISDANSQYMLGRYELDWRQDRDAALYWFRRASSGGNIEAMTMVTLLEK